MEDGTATNGSSRRTSSRWRLHRAGIINVYQYQNETFRFGGGRLLLRGVNGSGKSTAMNMLLPFLFTARLGRIDAAGEQSGMLKSWMLNGRDDAQPVGYLWLELERDGEFLTCGCGIKANRQSDTVSTWWFITSKRPGIDLWLIEKHVPLSADALRVALDGDEVFRHDRRRDYRAAIERRVFGGASIDQHIGLINIVRSPRVGDRIDVDLPDHLVAALPQLSEQALAEAAQPLDDLEEHRRNVAELARTADAVTGLLDVYRPYVITEISQRIESGRGHLATLATHRRDEARKRREANEAAKQVDEIDATITQLDDDIARLRREISTLEESQAYRDGQQLEGLRDLVANLAEQKTRATSLLERAEQRLAAAEQQLARAALLIERDHTKLNEALADLGRLGQRCLLTPRPPGTIAEPTPYRTAEGDGTLEVDELSNTDRALRAVHGAIRDRRVDLETVVSQRASVDLAERQLADAERARDAASAAAAAARERLDQRRRSLLDAEQAWVDAARAWARGVVDLAAQVQLLTPSITALAGTDDQFERAWAETHDPAIQHQSLLDEAQALVDHAVGVLAGLESALDQAHTAASEAKTRVDELAARTEPDPPRLPWQETGQVGLADLVDFSPSLDASERAGLEGALAASGLLSARVIDSNTIELADGDLLITAGVPAERSLADLLAVTVPDHLLSASSGADSIDPTTVRSVLASISIDASDGHATMVSVDGSFRLGTLSGRHHKTEAEFIGVTARRAALERSRAEAAAVLEEAQSIVADLEERRARAQADTTDRRQRRAALPSIAAIESAGAQVESAEAEAQRAEIEQLSTNDAVDEAERTSIDAGTELGRVATTLSLPPDTAGLTEVGRNLDECARTTDRSLSQIDALSRSRAAWHRDAESCATARTDVESEEAELARIVIDHDDQRARLATLEDSIGVDYREVVAARDLSKSELNTLVPRQPELRDERDSAVARSAKTAADVGVATQKLTDAEAHCDRVRVTLARALDVRGFLAALDPTTDAAPDVSTSRTGADGLTDILDSVEGLLTARADPLKVDSKPVDAVTADGVRQSLRGRRDSLGAGWDAETWQPDPTLPLSVEVNGPTGKATLAESARAVATQHEQLASLLNRKQDDALRELLQGLIAREVAEKVHGANRLVELMNGRLGAVSTAHDVGVRLRWRRSPELSPEMSRTVDLLATLPDLRTDDDERELRQALSSRLDEARRLQPDLPYRQLIANTLDYRQWHDMTVMLRRGGSKETKLGAKTPLSEGEKKLVTYLPLFAAVAASCDALAEQQRTPGATGSGINRFVLLDDAFAKVSEDNHASLFGLLVDLDLDLIATSERLWGTHDTVPEIAITEVVRDVDLSVILLEHYRWDGVTLERARA